MRKTTLMTFALTLLVTAFWPEPSVAQKLIIGKEPGTEVPEVTAGPGWKTCQRCQNKGHIAAARYKYKGVGHAFNARDLSGVWGNNGIQLDMKTIPPMTPYGQQLWEATKAVQTRPEIPAMNGGEGSKDP